jgi:hypothetical protein
MKTRVFAYFALIAITTSWLNAGVVPGRWEKVEALEEGYPIVVMLQNRERIEAAYSGLTDESLLLVKNDGEELDLPKVGVIKVESRDKLRNDSVGDGALWGAIVGGGVTAVVLAAYSRHEDVGAGLAAYSIALSSGIGMGVGVGLDAMVKEPKIFYEAPQK